MAAREIEPEDCAWIRQRIAPIRLLRAIAVRAGETLAEAEAHQEVADYLMLDAGAKGLAFAGAEGETHDWSVSRTVVERSRVPVILAGGLTVNNVTAAIAAVRPLGGGLVHTHQFTRSAWKKGLDARSCVYRRRAAGFATMIEQ